MLILYCRTLFGSAIVITLWGDGPVAPKTESVFWDLCTDHCGDARIVSPIWVGDLFSLEISLLYC